MNFVSRVSLEHRAFEHSSGAADSRTVDKRVQVWSSELTLGAEGDQIYASYTLLSIRAHLAAKAIIFVSSFSSVL